MLQQLGAAALAVHAGGVADVVAVALHPAHHRVLGVEDPVLGRVAARREGAVVADLVGAPGGRAGVEAVAAVAVVGLPGGVRGLEQQLGGAVVVADDEHHVAVASGAVLAHEPREVDARHRVGRHHPRGRNRPVAAVDQPGGRLAQAGRLLGHATEWAYRVDPARARPAVVAHPVDVEPVQARDGVDLELDRLPLVRADVGGEALDVGVARARHVPLAGGAARLGVLARDLVGDRRVAGRGRGRSGGGEGQHDGEDSEREDANDQRASGATHSRGGTTSNRPYARRRPTPRKLSRISPTPSGIPLGLTVQDHDELKPVALHRLDRKRDAQC